MRDSHVLFLSTEAFTRVVQAHPQAIRVISSALIDKLMNTIRQGSTTSPATSIVVLPLDDSVHVREFGRSASGVRWSPWSGRSRWSRPTPRAELGRNPSNLARAVWREHLEASLRRRRVRRGVRRSTRGPTNVCSKPTSSCSRPRPARHRDPARRTRARGAARDPPRTAWSWCCCTNPRPDAARNAQLARRAVHRSSPSHPRRPRRRLRARRPSPRGPGHRCGLQRRRRPRIARHRCVPARCQRVASRSTRRRAPASARSSPARSRGDSPDDVSRPDPRRSVDRSPVDLTLPTVSFRPAPGSPSTSRTARGLDVEDTWLNFLCVSTNLTRGRLEIHDRGPAWAAVRSSFSVPGTVPAR